MSWDCPHLDKDICKLNGIQCTPAKGNCVLRGKVQFMKPSKPLWENEEDANEESNPKRRFRDSNR